MALIPHWVVKISHLACDSSHQFTLCEDFLSSGLEYRPKAAFWGAVGFMSEANYDYASTSYPAPETPGIATLKSSNQSSVGLLRNCVPG